MSVIDVVAEESYQLCLCHDWLVIREGDDTVYVAVCQRCGIYRATSEYPAWACIYDGGDGFWYSREVK